MGIAKAWKVKDGLYSYITARGKRGMESTLSAAKKAAGVKSSSRSTGSKSSKSKSSGGGGRKTARKMTWPLTMIFGLAGTFLSKPQQDWDSVYGAWQAGTPGDIPRIGIRGLTGFDIEGIEKWTIPRFLLILLGAAGAHKAASMLGINRLLGQAKIPLVRV